MSLIASSLTSVNINRRLVTSNYQDISSFDDIGNIDYTELEHNQDNTKAELPNITNYNLYKDYRFTNSPPKNHILTRRYETTGEK